MCEGAWEEEGTVWEEGREEAAADWAEADKEAAPSAMETAAAEEEEMDEMLNE